MKACRASWIFAPLILNLFLEGGEWPTSRLGRFTPGGNPGTDWIGGCVGLRVALGV